MANQLNSDQIQAIRSLSFEAENFLQSNLYKKLMEALDKTKLDIVDRLFNNKRLEQEKDLTREQFVERLSAQYQTLYSSIAIIQMFAMQAKELDKQEEVKSRFEKEYGQSTSEDQK